MGTCTSTCSRDVVVVEKDATVVNAQPTETSDVAVKVDSDDAVTAAGSSEIDEQSFDSARDLDEATSQTLREQTFWSARSSATPEDLAGEGSDAATLLQMSNVWSPDEPAIGRILSDPNAGSTEQRASMALMLGAFEESTHRASPKAPPAIAEETNPAAAVESAATGATASPAGANKNFLGAWVQESMEAEKLEAILKIQGYSWPIRKVALSTKLNMQFEMDQDGDMLYLSTVPMAGQLRIKCVDGAGLDMTMMGTHMSYHMKWTAAGDLEMLQENTSGKNTTTSTITQKYDAVNDKIISENESKEGFYTRTFKRAEY